MKIDGWAHLASGEENEGGIDLPINLSESFKVKGVRNMLHKLLKAMSTVHPAEPGWNNLSFTLSWSDRWERRAVLRLCY